MKIKKVRASKFPIGILGKLLGGGSILSDLDGGTPICTDPKLSKLHQTYSIDGDPNIPNKPNPSLLDPPQPPEKYLDNPPG